jgi:hypothetical protein
MCTSPRISLALCVALLVALLASSGAQAAPITVNLRVEGSTKTLFEGPVSVEAIGESPGIEATSSEGKSEGKHPCDVKDNGGNGGFGAAGAPPIAALYEAMVAQHLAFGAGWSMTYNDFEINQIGEDIANSGENGEYWGYAVNYTTAEVGGCQVRLAPGSEVLWAYNFFGLPHLLSLSGPTSANVGTPFTVHVVDGQTGQPVAGAAIGQLVAGVTTTGTGSPVTDASGNATVTLTQVESETLKATQAESVRSNGLTVCVHNGNDGTCGTTVPGVTKGIVVGKALLPQVAPADEPMIGGIANGHHYRRHGGPRILRGLVNVPTGDTLREVRISLQRRNGKRCTVFSGAKETFVRARCGVTRFFSVGGAESFSYLLPASLPPGRYVYDIEAIDSNGQTTKLVAGVSHVVFYVK